MSLYTAMNSYKIEGYVAEGYERVRNQFEDNFINELEKCAQLCVYVGEKKVVDLWGSVTGCKKRYDGDTITNVFSSTKNLTVLCIAKLVDQNLLDYGGKVVTYWPEYGNGDKEKEGMTVADILRHECGMANLSKPIRLADILRENIKKNSIGRVIEKEPLRFPSNQGNNKSEYSGAAGGWILNEICRRVDPQRRTIGEFLRDEISQPLNIDCYIGLEYEQLTKPYELSASSLGQVLRSSLIPKFLGRKTEIGAYDLLKMMTQVEGQSKILEFMPDDIQGIISYFQNSIVMMGEMPGGNGICSARGLAKLAAIMANEGTMDGHELISKDTWQRMHSGYEEAKIMQPFGMPFNFSQGGVNFFTAMENASNEHVKWCAENREGYIGWLGLGGSIFQWRPDYKIGFAYVPTLLAWEGSMNARGALLQKIVVDCVKGIKKDKNGKTS